MKVVSVTLDQWPPAIFRIEKEAWVEIESWWQRLERSGYRVRQPYFVANRHGAEFGAQRAIDRDLQNRIG